MLDAMAVVVVRLGGIAIIAAILILLAVILVQVYPLLKSPEATVGGSVTIADGGAPVAVGTDEYLETAYVVTPQGVRLFSLQTGAELPAPELTALGGATVASVSALGRGLFVLGLSDGRAIPAEMRFEATYPEGKRVMTASLISKEGVVVDPIGQPVRHPAYTATETGWILAAIVGGKKLAIVETREERSLLGTSSSDTARKEVELSVEGEATALAIDGRGENAFVGSSSGQIVRVALAGADGPKVAGSVDVNTDHAGITTLGFLLGDRTLVVGDASGGVSSWQLLPSGAGERALKRVYDFRRHQSAVVGFSSSRRHKGFLTGGAEGGLHFDYGTTGETLLALEAPTHPLSAVAFAPRGDGFVSVSTTGSLEQWSLWSPHPEVTLRSLFGKIWYEGYEHPEYVWQSTGGTDDFEPKLSLTPLAYGTLKGAFYALLFAVPLALLGALYAAQFMPLQLKPYIKPTVEIMAALPSVVLGFLAGLWLAPVVERILPGLLLIPLLVPTLVVAALWVRRSLAKSAKSTGQAGMELFLLLPLVLGGIWLAIELGGWIELTLLAGDSRAWMRQALGISYDQRNSLVVGLAMGFAVIPLIFTIAEDAIGSVPPSLVAGSLALGATRWQTATRVVLPTASPGIFSAIMIGFGRAVGETMIVLMATGNTPIMDGSVFSGFRALSANIAVELPEAPEGGTLYRVLFLAALLLFVTTFVVNTLAELVRLRLRARYRVL